MPYDELIGWYTYLEQRPVDWRDDNRTYHYLQTQGLKLKPWEVFASLRPIYQPPTLDALNVTSFKKSRMFSKLLGAKDGEKLNFD
jgi:hypothetical protein